MNNRNLQIDDGFDPKLLPRGLGREEKTGIIEGEFVNMSRIVANDIITAAYDPYYSWTHRAAYDKPPLRLFSLHRPDRNIVLPVDCEVLETLEEGTTSDLRKIAKEYGIRLVERDAEHPFRG